MSLDSRSAQTLQNLYDINRLLSPSPTPDAEQPVPVRHRRVVALWDLHDDGIYTLSVDRMQPPLPADTKRDLHSLGAAVTGCDNQNRIVAIRAEGVKTESVARGILELVAARQIVALGEMGIGLQTHQEATTA